MVEHVDEEVGGLPRDAHRGLHLEHVLPVTGGLHDHPEFAHPFADRGGLHGRGFQCRTVANQFHAHVQAAAVHGADDGVPGRQLADAGLEVVADGQRIGLQAFAFQEVENESRSER